MCSCLNIRTVEKKGGSSSSSERNIKLHDICSISIFNLLNVYRAVSSNGDSLICAFESRALAIFLLQLIVVSSVGEKWNDGNKKQTVSGRGKCFPISGLVLTKAFVGI